MQRQIYRTDDILCALQYFPVGRVLFYPDVDYGIHKQVIEKPEGIGIIIYISLK